MMKTSAIFALTYMVDFHRPSHISNNSEFLMDIKN